MQATITRAPAPRADAAQRFRCRPTSRRAFLHATGAIAAGGAGSLAAACGAQDPRPTDGATGQTGATKRPVTFWHWVAAWERGFSTLADEFNAKQQATSLSAERLPEYWDKLTASLAAATGPDTFLMNVGNAKSWAFSKRVLGDLSAYVRRDKATAQALQTVLPAFTDWYTYEGKPFGVPFSYTTVGTHYVVDDFVQAGLTPPADLGDKWDWNMLREYAEKLTRRDGGDGVRWGFWSNAGYEVGWHNFVVANGGSVLDKDRRRCVIASAQAIEAIEYCVGLVRAQVSPTRQEMQAKFAGANASAALTRGIVSMHTFGDWGFDFYKQDAALVQSGKRWDVTFVPRAPKTGKTASTANFTGIVLNPESQAKDAAWRWPEYAIAKPVQDRIGPMIAAVPARQDSALEVYTDPATAGPPPNRKRLEAAIRATVPHPVHDIVTQQELTGMLNPVLNDVWDGRVAVAAGLRQIQDQLNQLFQQADAKTGR